MEFSNFHCVLFLLNSIFTTVYIIYINKLHNGSLLVALSLTPLPIHSVLLSFLSVVYILIAFLIYTILMHSKLYFPPCHNALNTRIHSLLVVIFLTGDQIF